jgi:hypothetical protein
VALELWKPVRGFEGRYEVSSLGNVKSLARMRKGKSGAPTPLKERILRQFHPDSQYKRVSLESKSPTYVHRIVAEAFVPNPLGLPEVNHIDGDKGNNRSENLEWVTHSENAAHASRSGLLAVGVRHGNSKLNESDVLKIDSLIRDGHSTRKIASRFGVGAEAVRCIRNGKTWAHLTGR